MLSTTMGIDQNLIACHLNQSPTTWRVFIDKNMDVVNHDILLFLDELFEGTELIDSHHGVILQLVEI